jgi:hypothetical protein
MMTYTLQFAIPLSDWFTGAAAAVGAEDRCQFALLTGHGNSAVVYSEW